ncbi:DUF6597 domain-containing transcriptional factor [Jatrophihabitans sp. DSM 45814]
MATQVDEIVRRYLGLSGDVSNAPASRGPAVKGASISSAGYREYPPPWMLTRSVSCIWEQQPVEALDQLIVPDASLDLIWLADRELVIAGADTGPRHVRLPGGALSSAIRLRPGAAATVLGIPASELRDQQVEASLVLGADAQRLAETLAAAAPELRLGLLADAVARRHSEPDTLVVAAANRLARPRARVSHVASELGVSERHLQRRVVTSIGYGPKMLARVIRLRRLATLTSPSLSARADEAGYASQAHMNDEVRRLTGKTPVRFLEDGPPVAA